jgi:prepilin-type N-terminal cleavage/methylation domain-containing protein
MRGHSSLRGNPTIRRSSGFTLVELIISIVLIGILAAVGSSMIADSFTTTRMVNAENASEGQARYALERLAREIREVKYVSSGATGNYCITTMTATNLVFTKTVSGTPSAVCGTADTTVNINYSSPNLTLGGAFLTTQVDTTAAIPFRFNYYQSDGTTTATNTLDIKFIQITLTVKDPTSGQSISQRTRVALRNA